MNKQSIQHFLSQLIGLFVLLPKSLICFLFLFSLSIISINPDCYASQPDETALSGSAAQGSVAQEVVDQEVVDQEVVDQEAVAQEAGAQEAGADEEEDIIDDAEDSSETTPPDAQESWVDDYYNTTNMYLHGLTFKADDFIGEEQEEDLPKLKASRFNFAIDTKIEEKDGLQFSVDLDFRADIKLPKTKERFGLFINTSAPDELPGEDPEDVQNPLLVGIEFISAFRRIPCLSSVAGVRVNRSPAFFTGITFRPHFEWDTFQIIPQQKVFWFSDDTGLGGLTSLRLDWLPQEDLLLRSLSAARYNEATEGIEWEKTFMIAFSSKGTFNNLDRGHGIKFSVFGHKTGSGIIDKYRIAYIYRRSIYKSWLFLQLGPEVNFLNTDDWDATPGFRFGLDVLFWTPEELET